MGEVFMGGISKVALVFAVFMGGWGRRGAGIGLLFLVLAQGPVHRRWYNGPWDSKS